MASRQILDLVHEIDEVKEPCMAVREQSRSGQIPKSCPARQIQSQVVVEGRHRRTDTDRYNHVRFK